MTTLLRVALVLLAGVASMAAQAQYPDRALTFVVDPMSAPSLEDASIDYIEDVMQQGFSINAPNAQASGGGCACGSGGCH